MAQDGAMSGNKGLRKTQDSDQVADAKRTVAEQREDTQTSGVGAGLKHLDNFFHFFLDFLKHIGYNFIFTYTHNSIS
jgi:hypothetical protein